jgi:hypothetical protein
MFPIRNMGRGEGIEAGLANGECSLNDPHRENLKTLIRSS